ncbi:MAG: glycosyltransferase family 4 protein [Saprospiraceae bacterium]
MKNRINHIVFLTPGFAADESDTKCLPYLQEYFLGLRRYISDLTISIISIEYPAVSDPYLWQGISVFPLGITNRGIASNFIAFQKTLSTLKKIQKRKPINIIHSFWLSKCALVGHWTSKWLGIKHITTAMGVDVLPEKNRHLKFLSLSQMNLVMVSDFQVQQFEKNYRGLELAVIPWGISSADSQKIPPSDKRTIDLLAVGDINYIKDYPLLIEIMAALHGKRKVKISIIGRDVSGGKIMEQIRHRKLTDYIKVLGMLPNEDVLQYMRHAKVLVHVSSYESQGFVFLEALKSGMHIVSREVGIAKPLSKWRIAEDVPSFVQAIEQSLANTAERQATILIPIEETVNNYLRLYQEIVFI